CFSLARRGASIMGSGILLGSGRTGMRVWLAAICLAVLAACAADLAEPAPGDSSASGAQDEAARGPEDDYRDAVAALEGGPDAQSQAEPLLRRAAEAGHVEAQFLLGLAHHTGRG